MKTLNYVPISKATHNRSPIVTDGRRYYWNGCHKLSDRNRVHKFAECNRLLTPVLVLGHEEDDENKFWANLSTGVPSVGIITRLWRDGEYLKGDAADVPGDVAKAIRNKAYRSVSCEIYNSFQNEGREYGMALRRVALLGGEIPQVKTLADLPMPDKLGNVKNIELFATGLHPTQNGDHLYTVSDLDEIVANFQRLSTCGTKVKLSERLYHVFHEVRHRPKVYQCRDGKWRWQGQRVPSNEQLYIIIPG